MGRVVGIMAVIAAGGLAFWFLTTYKKPAPPAPARRLDAQAVPVVQAAPDAAPQILHPIENVAVEPPSRLPGLDESDALIRERLAKLFGVKKLAEFFFLERIIRRVVATIDNLPRDGINADLWPLKPVTSEFLVTQDARGLSISPRNPVRYNSRLELAESIDPKKLVALYARHYPLFQKAYQELGYPQGYFNDRLIEVIDHLLSTPETPEPIKLVQPRVRYEYADPVVQARSPGQKILTRMGREHTARIKNILREIRAEVTGQRVVR